MVDFSRLKNMLSATMMIIIGRLSFRLAIGCGSILRIGRHCLCPLKHGTS